MAQQELNLLKFATVAVAQLRAGPSQVVRRDVLQSRFFAARLDDVPDNVLRDAFPPHLSRPGDCSKAPSLLDPGCPRPLIQRRFDPFWNGHGAHVAALADQVHDCPVPLAHLNFI
jgi:hypothetical protein